MSTILDDDDDDTRLFDRKSRRKARRHLMLSKECNDVLERTQDDGEVSKIAERAIWRYLIDQYGLEAVQAVIEDVQREFDPDDRADDPKPYTLEV